MRSRFRPRLEVLCRRRVLASITGTLINDAGGDHVHSLDDISVANGFVWADINRNGQYEVGVPSDYSDSDERCELVDVV